MKKYIKRAFQTFFKKESRSLSLNGFERIYYNHIRKCAGTSINIAMISALGGNEKTYRELAMAWPHKIHLENGSCVGWNDLAINKSSFFYAFSHIPLHRLKLEPTTFTFCFLRDPIERVISHFNMIKDLFDEGGSHPALKTERNFAFGEFDQFLSNIPKEHLKAQLFNFSADYDLEEAIKNLRSRVNYVGDIKDAQNYLIPFLSSEFDLCISYQKLRSSKFKFRPSACQYDQLQRMLYKEIEFKARAEEFFGLNV